MRLLGPQPKASADDQRASLRDRAHLYEAADELADRVRSGGAGQVLTEIERPLADAAAAGLTDVVDRLRYVQSLAYLVRGRLDDAVRLCEAVLAEEREPTDPAWMSAAHSIRGLARHSHGEILASVDDLTDAAVLLDDARPSGQPFVTAAHLLATGYTAHRLFELAGEILQRTSPIIGRPGFGVSRLVHVLTEMTVELFWGMELDRLGELADARAHIGAALEAAADAEPIPASFVESWALRLSARTGLCRAMLGQAEAAVTELEPLVANLDHPGVTDQTVRRVGLNVEAAARIGLVRAYGLLGSYERAEAEAARAESAAIQSRDVKLVLAATWERTRLSTRGPASAGRLTVVEYTQRLEEERWQERVRFNRETRDRLDGERERLRARRMAAGYLTDQLTGVANRRHLDLRLPEFVERAAVHQQPVALAFVDLDPETVTESLVSVASVLRTRVGPEGFVARYGGTELVVVLPKATAKELAELVARVLEDRPAEHREESRPSVGIAGTQEPISVSGLVAAADEALLAARRSGGGIRLAAASG